MRKFVLFLVIITGIYGCYKPQGNTQISGQIKGFNKGKLVLQKIEDTALVSIDSMIIYQNPEFVFSLELQEPEVLYLALKFDDSVTPTRYLPFFAEPGSLEIKTSLKGFGYDQKITGSKNQSIWDEFKFLQGYYNDKQLELIQAELTASQNNNASDVDKIQRQREKLLRARYFATVNFAKNHKDMPLAPYLMLSEIPDVNLKYHDTIYKLLNPEIKNSKYGKALELFMNQQKDSIL